MSEELEVVQSGVVYADGYAERGEVIRQLVLTREDVGSELGQNLLERAIDRLICSIAVVEPKSATVRGLKAKSDL